MTYLQEWLEVAQKPKQLLLVEDSEGDCRMIVEMSKDFNVEWTVCRNVPCAERELTSRKFHLVVLDLYISSPRDGVEFFKKIKKERPETPVMVLSGHLDDNIMSDMSRCGFVMFAQKPGSFTRIFFEQLFLVLNIPYRTEPENEDKQNEVII